MKKILSKRIQEMFQLETENYIIRIWVKPEDYNITEKITFCGQVEIAGKSGEWRFVAYTLTREENFEKLEDKLFNFVERNFILIPTEE